MHNIINNIFSVNPETFSETAKNIFHFQYNNNEVYRNWCSFILNKQDLKVQNQKVSATNKELQFIPPFLPISFFKTQTVVTTTFEPEAIFESSGTTQTINSQHLVKELSIYKESFLKAFKIFYGDIEDWCIIGLLPSYLERNNSSLIVMVDELIKVSKQADSGFYLNNYEELNKVLLRLEARNQKTLLIGVTFALLDFSEKFPMKLTHTIIMETGGMKGRRKELTRAEVHGIITNGLGVEKVHSEYGMTELLSQAYSLGDGLFICPPWMKVVIRDEDDPLTIRSHGRGVLNVIDLANIYSCSFIATDDIGIVNEDGSFEVIGRLDNSDIRGCSLMVI